MSEWISASDELPKVGQLVIFVARDCRGVDIGIVGNANFTGTGDPLHFIHHEDGDLIFGLEITHWLPVPAEPEGL